MDDYTEAQLSQFIDDREQDMTVEEVKPAFDEKMELVEDRLMEDADHKQKVNYAVSMLSGDDLQSRRTGNSGERMELSILSIGHRGIWEDHPATDDDTVTAHGVIHGPLNDDGSKRAAKAVFLLDRSDMDLLDVQTKFHCLNTLQGTFEVEEAWNLNNFYRVYSTENTTLTEVELDDLPSGRDEKNDVLRQMFEDVSLSELAENRKGLSSFDPDSGFTHDWGADIKRFSGTIVDYYIPDDRSFGIYTLMDDSVTPDDIEAADTIVGENQTVPGLTVFAEPDYHMNYGQNSIVDVYGVVETNDDGQITMRAAGIAPIVPMEMDDGNEADEGVKATESTI